MKTIFKILVAGIVGLVAAWLCFQVFRLEQPITTVAAVIVTLAAYTACDKIKLNEK